MEAIVYHRYGSPDVLQIKEVEKPVPGEDEVLVRIRAASANPADWHALRGDPFFARFSFGFPRPNINILGSDIAGTVEAVGRNVTQFQPGDEVFGDRFESGWGGFAEYVCVAADRLALKPANLTFAAAAAVPLAALTALQGLRDKGRIQPGQKVLINGASGGVGTFAVQLAKEFGAEVTGVCSTGNVAMVRAIGADHVVDYTREDFSANGHTYDLIFCAVGNRSAAAYARALKPGGTCVIAGFTSLSHMLLQVLILGGWVSMTGGKRIGSMGTVAPNKEDLGYLRALLESSAVVPVIDRCYPLDETAEAIRYLENGHAKGKVIIAVEDNGQVGTPAS
jgi:NADPH:quinone reductase-like Zn-dependent oxidoreductase